MKKVVVFGAQRIAIECLDYLLGCSGVQVVGVVGSDNPRDLTFSNTLVSDYCHKKGLWFQDGLNQEQLKALEPDLMFSLYYRKLLPKELLDCAKLGAFNIHPGLLPKYRGCVPTYWALLNGERTAGTTLHRMTEGIDDGDIVAQREFEVGALSGPELHQEAMKAGVELFKSSLDALCSGQYKATPQDHAQATYFGPYRASYRYLNWNDEAKRILRHLKAHRLPYQGSTTWNKHCEVRIDAANLHELNGWAVGKYELRDGWLEVQAQDYRIRTKGYTVLSGQLKEHGQFVSGVKDG